MPVDESTTAERIAGNIRAELGRRRWSRRKLAERVGMDERTLTRRLNTPVTSPFRVSELDAIAEVLDLTAADLFGER